MSKRPFLAVGLFSFLAALCCSRCSLQGVAVVAALSFIALVASVILRRFDKTKAAVLAATGALLVSGAFLIKECLVVYHQLAYADNTASLTVRIEKAMSSSTYLARVVDGDIEEAICLYVVVANDNIAPKAGDLLHSVWMLSPMFENATFEDSAFAKTNNAYLTAWPEWNAAVIWEDGSDTLPLVDDVLYTWRETIHNTLYRYMSFDDAALCEATILGNRQNLSGTIEWAFRSSGVYHLLAVSGLHLTILTGAVLWLLGRFGLKRRWCALAAVVTSVAFMALCGFSSSVTRAGVMTLIVLFGMLFRRRADGLNSLGLAAFVMLLIDPFTIYDLGFQLSFAATVGMLVLFPVWERDVTARFTAHFPKLGGIGKPILSSVGVSLCATLMTQPLTALYFKTLSVWFLPGNLLCVFAAEVLLVLSVLAVLFSGAGVFGDTLFWMTQQVCLWLKSCTSVIAELPFSNITVRDPVLMIWVCALTVIVIGGYLLMKMRGVRQAFAMMFAVLLVILSVSKVVSIGSTSVIMMPTSTAAFAVKTDDSSGLVFRGDGVALEKSTVTLQYEGITQLDWVLWLNEPSSQSIDLSSLRLPIKQLILTEDAAAYASLPTAETVTVLQNDGSAFFSQNSVIEQQSGCYRVAIGKTHLLLCGVDADMEALPEEWRQNDIVLFDAIVPADLSLLEVDYLIAFCSYMKVHDLETQIPRTAGELYFAVRDDMPVFMTRGENDISLRTW